MRTCRASTSTLVRFILFCIVLASLAASRRPGPAGSPGEDLSSQAAGLADVPSFSRAFLGFTASVAMIVCVLLLVGAQTDAPPPETFKVALRGSID
jgi:hypothetical protein